MADLEVSHPKSRVRQGLRKQSFFSLGPRVSHEDGGITRVLDPQLVCPWLSLVHEERYACQDELVKIFFMVEEGGKCIE